MSALLRGTITTAVAAGALVAAGCAGGDGQAPEDTPANAASTGTSGQAASPAGTPECAPGDLTAAVSDSPAPNDQGKLFRLTFSAADGTTSCYLSGPPQALVFRDGANAELPVEVTTDPGADKPQQVLVDAGHQAEATVTTAASGATIDPARTDFTMPTGGPNGTTFSLDWPGTISSTVTVTPVTAPAS